jgi:dipeptidase
MCDTFVATASATADGSVIFGKNSNREANEAQALEYLPAREHPADARLKCTYIEIPQVPATQAVLLCRPFWMWGAEMGANAAGLVVGNEAVWTRMPLNRQGGLTGMDLVRLALERARTAEQGIEVIAGLLHDFGQGGICGYRDRRMIYHNSFMVADPQTAWVLETAGPYWAAKQIRGIYAISNGLTLGDDFDRGHPDLGRFGKSGKPLHFTRHFSNRLYTFFSASRRRRSFAQGRLADAAGQIDVRHAIGLLQDHGTADYRPDSHWLGDRICAHATNGFTRKIAQTTGSLVAHLKPDGLTVWVTGTAAPCTAIFKPLRFSGAVLPDIGPSPGSRFNPASLWWFHEQFHRRLLFDFEGGHHVFRKERQDLQNALIRETREKAAIEAYGLSGDAFRRAREWTEKQIRRIATDNAPRGKIPRLSYRRYWANLNRQANIPI